MPEGRLRPVDDFGVRRFKSNVLSDLSGVSGMAILKVDLQENPIGPRPKGKRGVRWKAPKFALRTELYRLTGVDFSFSQVGGIDVPVAQT